MLKKDRKNKKKKKWMVRGLRFYTQSVFENSKKIEEKMKILTLDTN